CARGGPNWDEGPPAYW
nr:immunoglobulin heavy chain junction region [Mus musculus]NSM05248.1 immunoglobulin heavy chain junction region [Mus musculus]NSM08534.1 immunoglobulin heavy chain junction region [Mus musculus]